MCVALPGLVVSIGDATDAHIPAEVDFGDRTLEINLVMVPEAREGDWVIAHSGFAIRRTDNPSFDIDRRG
ncbi:MAG: HypC/HybG/HupF family hydrogenase formation chaperone [Acidimicrobiia bacterium]